MYEARANSKPIKAPRNVTITMPTLSNQLSCCEISVNTNMTMGIGKTPNQQEHHNGTV